MASTIADCSASSSSASMSVFKTVSMPMFLLAVNAGAVLPRWLLVDLVWKRSFCIKPSSSVTIVHLGMR